MYVCMYVCKKCELVYVYQFTLVFQPAEAEQAVQCLERLSTNHYRKLYHRKQESSFAGDIVVKNPWLLSNGE